MSTPTREQQIFTPCQTENHDDCVGATYALYRDHRLVYCSCACHRWSINNQPEDAANTLAKFEVKE